MCAPLYSETYAGTDPYDHSTDPGNGQGENCAQYQDLEKWKKCSGCHGKGYSKGTNGWGCRGWSMDPYSLRSYDALAFGKIVFPSHGTGSVYIEPRTGDKTLEGGTFDLGGHSSPAVFEIIGEPGMQFEVVLPNNVVMRPKSGRVEIRDMSVWPNGVLLIDPTGSQEFKVGGRMFLPSGVKPGKYSARFSVFVNQIMQ